MLTVLENVFLLLWGSNEYFVLIKEKYINIQGLYQEHKIIKKILRTGEIIKKSELKKEDLLKKYWVFKKIFYLKMMSKKACYNKALHNDVTNETGEDSTQLVYDKKEPFL